MNSSCLFFLMLLVPLSLPAKGMPPPLVEVSFETRPEVFEHASATRPLVITSMKEAETHFTEKGMDALRKRIDFSKQALLVFAWSGSGQDRIETAIAESYPEQISFQYKRGRTRDLRSHVKMFALRNNVTWTAK